MTAERNSVVIVDEPEMYVHRSVRNKLWSNIERSRRDCVFIYLTHDLDFVRSRPFFRKFVVQSYTKVPESWSYGETPSDASADEALQMTVWGHRQSTLLVEGSADSLDLRILSLVYPDFLIVPAGSCDDVRHSVSVLRRQRVFHHQDVFGLIDRDVRGDDEISKLRRKKIYCLGFREIENLLISEEVIRAFLHHVGYNPKDSSTVIGKILSVLRKRFTSLVKKSALNAAKRQMANALQNSISSANSAAEIDEFVHGSNAIDIYNNHEIRLKNLVDTGSWNDVLSVFSVRKDDFGQVIADALDFKNFATYRETILRIAENKDDAQGVKAAGHPQKPSHVCRHHDSLMSPDPGASSWTRIRFSA